MVVPFGRLLAMRLIDARLYYICGIDRLDTVEPALRGGVDIFQLRDKHASDDELLRAAAVARRLCDEHGALFVLNDRPDLAVAAGADYIGVGPVHATPTKLGRPAVGTQLVRYAAEHASVPFFAIGGLDAETLPGAVAAGATRAAVVRAISEAPDPEAAARELRAA